MATNTYVLWMEYGKEEHIKDVLTNTILRDHQEHTTLYVPKKIKLLRGTRGANGTRGQGEQTDQMDQTDGRKPWTFFSRITFLLI